VRSKPTGHRPTARYTVTLVNNDNNKAFEQAALVVKLLASTTYVKGTVSPRPRVPGGNKYNKTLATPVYNTIANTVAWQSPRSSSRRPSLTARRSTRR